MWRGALIFSGIAILLRIAANGLYPPSWEHNVQRTIFFVASFPSSYLSLKYTLARHWTSVALEAQLKHPPTATASAGVDTSNATGK